MNNHLRALSDRDGHALIRFPIMYGTFIPRPSRKPYYECPYGTPLSFMFPHRVSCKAPFDRHPWNLPYSSRLFMMEVWCSTLSITAFSCKSPHCSLQILIYVLRGPFLLTTDIQSVSCKAPLVHHGLSLCLLQGPFLLTADFHIISCKAQASI